MSELIFGIIFLLPFSLVMMLVIWIQITNLAERREPHPSEYGLALTLMFLLPPAMFGMMFISNWLGA